MAFAAGELATLGIADPATVTAGYVVRMPRAYPTYDEGYLDRVDTVREWLEAEVTNVIPMGRNGMHKYNNQDHSMYTAMLTVENLYGADHDIWAVNVEEEYHEEGEAVEELRESGTGRAAPVIPKAADPARRH